MNINFKETVLVHKSEKRFKIEQLVKQLILKKNKDQNMFKIFINRKNKNMCPGNHEQNKEGIQFLCLKLYIYIFNL